MTIGRSPLKSPPLRNPAESLIEQRNSLIDDHLWPYIVVSLMLVFISGYFWLEHFGVLQNHAPTFTVVTAIMIGITLVKFFQIRRQCRFYNSGIEAEKAVGQFLEQFLEFDQGKVGSDDEGAGHADVGPASGVAVVQRRGRRDCGEKEEEQGFRRVPASEHYPALFQ